MKKLVFVIALACLLAAVEARAQALTIVSTDPPQGAVSVPLSKKVVFKLNKGLPPFGTQFADKFLWSPEDSTQLSTFGHDCESTGPCAPPPLVLIFFTLDHTPNTDFSFIAYGVVADDGSRMERPFVLNYTTAPTHGTRRISGTVAFGARGVITRTAQRLQMEAALRRTFTRVQPRREGTAQSPSLRPGLSPAETPATTLRLAASSQDDDLNRTVVLLMDAYTLEATEWTVRAAAVPDETGTFTFNGVRDGTYWPVAINFATEDGETIGSYGFYDADGDFEPDSLSVNGDQTDIDLDLFGLRPFTAQENLALATLRAEAEAPGQRLIKIQAVGDFLSTAVFADGTAMNWRYTFYDPSQNQVTVVDVAPINLSVTTRTPFPAETTQAALPPGLIGSNTALQIAEQNGGQAFRNQYGADVPVFMQAGDLDLAFRPLPPRLFWQVNYISGFTDPREELIVFIDLETGAVLDGVFVGTEEEAERPGTSRLFQNAPNPFTDVTTLRFDMAGPGLASLRVYNAIGQEVAVLVDGYRAAGPQAVAWNAAGLPAGVYFYRLDVAGATQTRAMIRH